MGFLKILKKSKIPDELPELISDEIEENNAKRDITPPITKAEELIDIEELPIKEEVIRPKPEPKKELIGFGPNNKSFVTELEKNINQEINDLSDLENWYKDKFLPRDIVTDMRKYWEKQKNSSVIKILGKNLNERITEKTNKLQELEKEWQNIYFDLIEKEEEIRGEERDLKKVLAEFLETCKRREVQSKDRIIRIE